MVDAVIATTLFFSECNCNYGGLQRDWQHVETIEIATKLMHAPKPIYGKMHWGLGDNMRYKERLVVAGNGWEMDNIGWIRFVETKSCTAGLNVNWLIKISL